jgi:uncharacterized protein YcfL
MMLKKAKYAALVATMMLTGLASTQATETGTQYDHAGNLVSGVVMTSTGDPRLKEVEAYVTVHIKPWLSDPLIVKMVNAQNADTNKLKQAQIDTLDIAWLERSDPHLINAKMNNELSTFLRKKRDELKDVVMEIFIYDDLGLNVGQTDLTEDYNQGDETKYWKSFGSGPDGMVVEKIKPDGGRPHISQASLAIKDPATGKAIGAVTIGIDYDGLAKMKK